MGPKREPLSRPRLSRLEVKKVVAEAEAEAEDEVEARMPR